MTVTALASPPGADAAADKAPQGGKKKKKLVLVLVVVVLLGGAGWFVLRPSSGGGAPVPGEVVPLEPIQVNLAGGHYLKVGIALQLVEGGEKVDGSKALDAVIEQFSGRPMDELTQPVQREKLKKALGAELDHRYDGEVMGVYFTDFVTQ
jgi:flagellar FliL protein